MNMTLGNQVFGICNRDKSGFGEMRESMHVYTQAYKKRKGHECSSTILHSFFNSEIRKGAGLKVPFSSKNQTFTEYQLSGT